MEQRPVGQVSQLNKLGDIHHETQKGL
jgi:hypothetical protein